MRYVKERDQIYCELLRLARVSDDARYTGENLARAVDVLNELCAYVDVHRRIIPLLNAKVRKLNVAPVLNNRVRAVLLSETRNGAVTELAKMQQLSQILDALRARRIPVILLKGVAFSGLLYSANAPRTSNDIDLLIRPRHWPDAIVSLRSTMKPLEKEKAAVFDNLYETSFIPCGKSGASVDLHKDLTSPGLFSIDEEELWESSVMHPGFNDVLIRTLSPEHMLVHQAIHAFKDLNFCKYNLVDAHEIIEQLRPDLATVVTIAKRWGVHLNLYFMLAGCKEIMGTTIDEDILNRVRPSFPLQYLGKKILELNVVRPADESRFFFYRVIQLASLYVFTGSVLRPIRYQWLYLKTAMERHF